MPKHGITALVDFVEPFEAKKAFTKLAYSQFKAAPLYLEWAPENVFIKSAETIPINNTDKDESSNVTVEEMKTDTKDKIHEIVTSKDNLEDDTNLDEPENDTTLFVKNLNFKTNEESLRSVSFVFIYYS